MAKLHRVINSYATPSLVAKLQALIIGCLLTLHIYHLYYYYFKGIYLPQFDLNSELNLPTKYASLILLVCALCLFYIAYNKFKRKAAFKYAWLLLGFIFLFLSYDEYFMVHDPLSPLIRKQLTLPFMLYFAWVIPYSILTFLFALFYLKFWISLPKPYRTFFFLSGAIFVAGAIGCEMIGAPYKFKWGRDNEFYAFFTTLEEVLEMAGIAFFLYALVRYIHEYYFKRTEILQSEEFTTSVG